MGTSLADLLAGVDMEGGENFCDSVYNFLKNQGKDINLFTNSGFGVWSRSDTNKGLATLPFDSGSVEPVVGETLTDPNSGAVGKVITVTVTGGTFPLTNAVGTIELGAVSGTYQDNSLITGSVGGANMLTVNGDATIGVRNDPMNNNSVGLWTDDGAGITLAFVAAEYTVTTNAGNQRAWIANAALEAGKIYKIELDIKDGTAATQDIEGYFDDGAAQYGKIEITAAGWASVYWTFECATTTAAGKVGFRIPTSLAASNIEIRRFSCYEITPCATAADNLAFDGWHKDLTCDIYRQHWHATYSKCGSFYSLKIVPSDADDYVIFPLFTAVSDEEYWYKQFCRRPVTIGAWVLTNQASHARVYIGDDVSGAQYSDYHTGGGDWEWLELTFTIDEAATRVLSGFYCALAGDVDGTTIVYVSQPMWVFGWSLGEGMYQPRLQEMIWLNKFIVSNGLDKLLDQGDVAATDVNLEADTDAKLPKGCKAMKVFSSCRDPGSFANNTYLILRADATQEQDYTNDFRGINDDWYRSYSGLQVLDVNGDFDYAIQASGGATFDLFFFRYLGIQVN